MASSSLLGSLLVFHGRIINIPSSIGFSGSRWQEPSFFFKAKKENSELRAGKKIEFRRGMISATILSNSETKSAETLRPQTYVNRHSIWGNTFSSFVSDNKKAEEYAKEIEPLKEEVRAKLVDETNNELEKLHLIDILERLGIFYHFEKEIDDNLENIFNIINGFEQKNQYGLYDAALLFRILRQHGFDISSEIFKKFKDGYGTFKEELSYDPKGLLSLYDASFVRRHGDDILEDALSFTKSHLERMAPQVSSSLKKQVGHAFIQSLHHGYERTEAYYNITFYEEDESKDEKLLQLAKLDFNLLQMLHKQELSHLTRWWNPIISKFDYARDRLVECYYTALGQYFEPEYSVNCIMFSKSMIMDSLIGDTFDAYGTLEELKMFTDAVEMWDYEEIKNLPDYMKFLYETLLNLYQDYDEELRKLERSFALYYWKRGTQELVKAYYKEARWIMGGFIPSFEDYLTNGCISITVYQMIPVSLFTSKAVTIDTFKWLDSNHEIVDSCGIANRLYDDTATFEDDKGRGQLTTGIECYMEQYGVSKEETIAKLHEMIEDAWKDINGKISRSSQIPMFVFRMILNYTRVGDVFYNSDKNRYVHVDGSIKSELKSLLIDPFNV